MATSTKKTAAASKAAPAAKKLVTAAPAVVKASASKTKAAPAAVKPVAAAPKAKAPPPVADKTKETAPAAKPAAAAAAKSAPKLVSVPQSGEVKKYAGFTAAELLKMPESAYMEKKQLAFFKELLTELHLQILNNATDTGAHLRDNDVATDPSDRATQEEEYTLELRTRDRERKLLKKVEKALRMIEDGSFGWCEETGEPIGLARLIARPTASLSIEAQERRERMQKQFGD